MALQLESEGAEVAKLILLEGLPPKRSNHSQVDVSQQEPQFPQGTVSLERTMQTIFEQLYTNLERLPTDYAERFGQVTWQQMVIADRYWATTSVKAPIALLRTQTYSPTVYEGWNEIGASSIEEHIVPGDASSMLSSPNVAILAQKMEQVLEAIHP